MLLHVLGDLEILIKSEAGTVASSACLVQAIHLLISRVFNFTDKHGHCHGATYPILKMSGHVSLVFFRFFNFCGRGHTNGRRKPTM